MMAEPTNKDENKTSEEIEAEEKTEKAKEAEKQVPPGFGASRPDAMPPPASNFNFSDNLDNFGNLAMNSIMRGITNFVNIINEVADRIEERAEQVKEQVRQEYNVQKDFNKTNNNAPFFQGGVNIRSARPPSALPPFGQSAPPFPGGVAGRVNVNPPASPEAIPTREPIIDIFDETEEAVIIVVAELPGVLERDIFIELQDDILLLKATSRTYNYEKECLLPALVERTPLERKYQNGMLELRLKRVPPPAAPESDNL